MTRVSFSQEFVHNVRKAVVDDVLDTKAGTCNNDRLLRMMDTQDDLIVVIYFYWQMATLIIWIDSLDDGGEDLFLSIPIGEVTQGHAESAGTLISECSNFIREYFEMNLENPDDGELADELIDMFMNHCLRTDEETLANAIHMVKHLLAEIDVAGETLLITSNPATRN